MRRFSTLVTSILFLLILLCAGAMIAGRVQPQSEAIPGFGMCDLAPCYAGIRADQTSWPATVALLNESMTVLNHHADLSEQDYEFADRANAVHLVIASDNGFKISTMTLRFPDAYHPKLGDLIAAYGVPCSIEFSPPDGILLVYSQMQIRIIATPRFVVSTNSEVDAISLYTTFLACDQASRGFYRWHGFGVVR